MQGNKLYRNRLFFTWVICYLVILFCYLICIRQDTNKPDRMLELFGLTSALILPQLTLMVAFFFEKSDEEVNKTVKRKPNSIIAYWFSIGYILIYTILIILSIPLDLLFHWTIDESTGYLILIMGHLSLFSTIPTVYLFGSK